ncbi:MAG TPA: phospholipase D-like domain-containing protein [Galbitalea sp.]|jgi:phosphatidylserine/phosphatidylglycerophosphate/cardiolipin synthase-like enzyme|nr:phospholipase D-like domain-containing protein [Galbitalea sp.]
MKRRTTVAVLAVLAGAVALALAGCAVTPSTPSEFTLVQYPAAGFSGLYAQTAGATKSIDMEMYELDDPTEEAALIAAHRRGVTVRVLLDAAYELRTANEPTYTLLRAGGVQVRFGRSSTIFHIKTTTFDGAISDISTANLTPQYYATTRDAEIVDSYPVQVRAIERTFDNDWAGQNPASDEANAPGLIWSPNAEQAMINQINSASTSIQFTSEELSDPYIYRALADDAQRGVKCEIVMMDDPDWAKAFGQVTSAGCVVHVLPDTPTGLYMHEKLVLVDAGTSHESAMIGSQNASYSSLAFNRELSIVLTRAEAPDVVRSLASTFARDFAASQPWPH